MISIWHDPGFDVLLAQKKNIYISSRGGNPGSHLNLRQAVPQEEDEVATIIPASSI